MADESSARLSSASLLEYVGAGQNDREYADQAWAEAQQLVDNLFGTAAGVPTEVRDRCYLEAGAELFHRKGTKNGIAQFATPDGNQPYRAPRDPLVGVYPLARPYIGGGFA